MVTFILGLINIVIVWGIVMGMQLHLNVPVQYQLYTTGIAMVASICWTWLDIKETNENSPS